jgi:hypothetical protein
LHEYGVEQEVANAIAAATAAASSIASHAVNADDAHDAEETPAEFLDALTCDIMADPVRLPRYVPVCTRLFAL